jgi:hypothetical protein
LCTRLSYVLEKKKWTKLEELEAEPEHMEGEKHKTYFEV